MAVQEQGTGPDRLGLTSDVVRRVLVHVQDRGVRQRPDRVQRGMRRRRVERHGRRSVRCDLPRREERFQPCHDPRHGALRQIPLAKQRL